MKRPVLTVATVLVGSLAAATISACGSSTSGHGSASSESSGRSRPSAGSAIGQAGTSSIAVAPAPSGPGAASGGHHAQPTHGTGSAPADHDPRIVQASATCKITSYADLPGLSHVPQYTPVLTWHVANATGMALSVDNPGLVGSYGTYGKTGTLQLGGGCYVGDQPTTITFYTVGGTGPRAHRTIVLTGTHNKITAPPEATTPTSTPSS